MIREAKEAKESFIAELERHRLEEENRAKEMAEHASKEIAAAQARSQVAEQQTLAASKMAEERIQKATREALKLQEAFMETLKRFNTDPIHKIAGQRQPQVRGREGMDSVDSGSENEVLHSLSQIPDDDGLTSSLATLPPESSDSRVSEGGSNSRDTSSRKKSPTVSLSKVKLFQVLRVFNIC